MIARANLLSYTSVPAPQVGGGVGGEGARSQSAAAICAVGDEGLGIAWGVSQSGPRALLSEAAQETQGSTGWHWLLLSACKTTQASDFNSTSRRFQ